MYERIYHEAGAHTADAHALPRPGPAHPRGGEACRSSATASTSPCATSSTTRRPSRRSAGAPACPSCTPHEARPDSLDQLLPGLRRDRPGLRAACRAELVDGVPPRSSTTCWPPASSQVSVVSAVEYARERGGVPSSARSRDHLRRAGAQRRAVLPPAGRRARRLHACSYRVLAHVGAAARPDRAPPLETCSPRYATARAEAADLAALAACRTTRCS